MISEFHPENETLAVSGILAIGISFALFNLIMLKPCLNAIAKKLRWFRSKNHLRQNDVADETGISPRYYQEIEAGRVNMTLHTLIKLARFFRVRLPKIVSDCPDFSRKE